MILLKKVKLICIIGWIVGALLMILPFLLAAAHLLWGDASVGIVGGADWPTFRFILGEYTWMAHLGVSISLALVVFYLRHRRYIKNR